MQPAESPNARLGFALTGTLGITAAAIGIALAIRAIPDEQDGRAVFAKEHQRVARVHAAVDGKGQVFAIASHGRITQIESSVSGCRVLVLGRPNIERVEMLMPVPRDPAEASRQRAHCQLVAQALGDTSDDVAQCGHAYDALLSGQAVCLNSSAGIHVAGTRTADHFGLALLPPQMSVRKN